MRGKDGGNGGRERRGGGLGRDRDMYEGEEEGGGLGKRELNWA